LVRLNVKSVRSMQRTGAGDQPRSRRMTPQRRTTPAEGVTAIVVLSAVSLFNYVDRSLISILQVPIKADLGLSDAQLGAITGLSFALFYATAGLPIARLVDRGQRNVIMACALTVWTLMTALSGLASNFATLVALRIGVALGEAGSVPATQSLLTDYFPLNRRGTALAVWALASPAGVMVGVFSGGWLASTLGWRASFGAVGLAGLWLVPVLLLLMKEPPRGQFDPPSSQTAPPPLKEAVGTLWNNASFRLLVAGATLQSFAYTSLVNWLPPFFARAHHMPLREVGTWAALIIGIGGGGGALLAGLASDALSKLDVRWYAWVPGVASILAVPFGWALFLAPSRPAALGLGFVTVFFANAYVAPINVIAQSLVSPWMRGFTAAVLIVVPTILGVGLGPFLTGLASDWFLAHHTGPEDALRYAILLAISVSLGGGGLLLALAKGLASRLRPALRELRASS
jgi:predicted MFS family arabinose efflux permease